MPTPKIAITGGIAEGKSTVLGYCRDAGTAVCSVDEVARSIFDSEPVQAGLARLLGQPFPIARADVRKAIVASPVVRRALNHLTHPLLLDAIRRSDATVFEVPLLVETCLIGEFDQIWVVTCGPEEQLKRLSERIGREDATALIRTQLPTTVKTPFADAIIRTNAEERNVQRYVLGLLDFRSSI
jgi:dephospho-CoA kinase